MKTSLLIPIAFIAFCFLSLLSCDQAKAPPSEEDETLVKGGPVWCTDTCEKGANGRYLEVSYTCDSCWTANFAANEYQFPDVPDENGEEVALKGVKVDVAELAEILEKIELLKLEHDSVALYAMFGIIFNPDDSILTPKIVFQVEGISEPRGKLASGKETENFYFDFTSSCPTYCPD